MVHLTAIQREKYGMTEKKRVYLIAHLDDVANRKLDELYDLLRAAGLTGAQKADFPHHITLGEYDLSQEAQALALTKAVCARTAPFTVELNHLGLFGTSVLFAGLSVNHELLTLHEALMGTVLWKGGVEWVAHATLLMDEPEAVLRAVPIAAQAFSPMRATIDSVGVFEYAPSKLLARYPLSGAR